MVQMAIIVRRMRLFLLYGVNLAFNDIAGNEIRQQSADIIVFIIMHLSKLNVQCIYYSYLEIYKWTNNDNL